MNGSLEEQYSVIKRNALWQERRHITITRHETLRKPWLYGAQKKKKQRRSSVEFTILPSDFAGEIFIGVISGKPKETVCGSMMT